MHDTDNDENLPVRFIVHVYAVKKYLMQIYQMAQTQFVYVDENF